MVSLHERAKDVFLAALERPSDERRAYVVEACGTDAALAHEVESLLKFHEETGSTDLSGTTTGHPGGPGHDIAPDVRTDLARRHVAIADGRIVGVARHGGHKASVKLDVAPDVAVAPQIQPEAG